MAEEVDIFLYPTHRPEHLLGELKLVCLSLELSQDRYCTFDLCIFPANANATELVAWTRRIEDECMTIDSLFAVSLFLSPSITLHSPRK